MVLHSPYPDVKIPELSLHEYIFKVLYSNGKKVAFIDAPTGREFTFAAIADEVVKLGSALHKRGLRKGDIVGICAPNSPQYIIVILAATACGAVVTTCNPVYTHDELKHQLQQSCPKFVFTFSWTYPNIKKIAETNDSIKKIYTFDDAATSETYASLFQNETGIDFPRNVPIDVFEDIAILPYSSGTTGLSKGVMLTHHNLVSCIVQIKIFPGIPSDCLYTVLPMFHIYGIVVAFAGLDQGIKNVLDVRFDVEKVLGYIQKYKVTRCPFVPPIILALAKYPSLQKYDLSSLISINSGAAPMSSELADEMYNKIGCIVKQGWGLTEAVPITASDLISCPTASVGRVCANTKLKVIDITTGEELGPHQDGELCVKGPQVMKGYYKNPKATTETIDPDGWLHTGDIGHYDDDEMVYVVDRLKELIKYKGFQVAPAELEAILLCHPKIADSAVIGIPDKEAGEVPRAFIVKKDPTLTKDEINHFIEGKVSKYKYLRGGIEFRSMIEKSLSGKILRRNLRKQFVKPSL